MSEYKLVPVEPTPEMLNAQPQGGRFENRLDLRPSIYRAMLAAAPAVQQPDVTQLVEALEKYESAFKELFVQCCSNPVTNAWGQPVSMAALNDAHAFASSRLTTHRLKETSHDNR